MRTKFLPFSPPLIGQDEIDEVADTLRSDWITTGPKTKRFENEFQAFVHAPAALALSSCTAGLHTALATLGIGPGDEVITTTLTFCSTVNVVEHVGARPVLVDIEPDTMNIDPARVAAAITSRTKVIMPVHYAGHPANLDQIEDIAKRHSLQVVEDGAHAVSAKYKGRLIGASNNPVSFSFYATKNLTTAEGGMLTGNPDFISRARLLSLHGMSKDAWKRYANAGNWYYEVVTPGFKYNMTDIQASIGLWQLKKLQSLQDRRREIVSAYNAAFTKIEALELPAHRPDVDPSWHLYVLRLQPELLTIDRNTFIEELKKRNIGTSVHYVPIHMHPYYRDKYHYRPGDFPQASENFNRMLSLPLSPKFTDSDVRDVIDAVLEIVGAHER